MAQKTACCSKLSILLPLATTLKVPFWDPVQKKRVLKVSFDFFLNRVARSGAGWSPIALLAKGHIGITSYEVCMARPNLELATRRLARKKSRAEQNALRKRGRATARAARNGRHAP